jgi:hypothetical protein
MRPPSVVEEAVQGHMVVAGDGGQIHGVSSAASWPLLAGVSAERVGGAAGPTV